MTEFHGFLFSKLHSIGTKSEGPLYILQLFDETEIVINKKATPWQQDLELQKFISTKVTITGECSSAGLLDYEGVSPFKGIA
jgi:hypothetical protein